MSYLVRGCTEESESTSSEEHGLHREQAPAEKSLTDPDISQACMNLVKRFNNSGASVGDVELVPESERERLQAIWNLSRT